MDNDQKLCVLMDSLGDGTDVDFAREVLASHGWDLEAALNTMTAAGTDSGAPAPSRSTLPAYAVDEDGYRAPMRTGYRDTLLGPDADLDWAAASMAPRRGGRAADLGAELGGPHSGGTEDVRQAMQASAAEYARYADQQEQGAIAEALQMSYSLHARQEQHRLTQGFDLERTEQEELARAIEASYREQSRNDASFRAALDQATVASVATRERGAERLGSSEPGHRSAAAPPPSGAGPHASASSASRFSATAASVTATAAAAGESSLGRASSSSGSRRTSGSTSLGLARTLKPTTPSSGPSALPAPGRPLVSPVPPRGPAPVSASTSRSSPSSIPATSLARAPARPALAGPVRSPPAPPTAVTPSRGSHRVSARPSSELASDPRLRENRRSQLSGGSGSRDLPGGAIAPGQAAAASEAQEADQRRRAEEERRRLEDADRRRRQAEAEAAAASAATRARLVAEERRRAEVAAEAERKVQEERRRAEAEQRRRQAEAEAEEQQRRRQAEAEAEQRRRQAEAQEQRRREAEAEATAKAAEAAAKAAAEAEVQRRREAAMQADRRRLQAEAAAQAEREQLPPCANPVKEQQESRVAVESAAPAVPEAEVDEVRAALVNLRRLHLKANPGGLATCLQTLRTYIGNLAKAPHEPKFQRINGDNAAFRTRVAVIEGSSAVLQACGFVQEGTTWVVDQKFIKTKGPRLWDALAKVDVLMDQATREAS